MLFNSLAFFLFFAVVLSLHQLKIPWTLKKANLAIASCYFYAAWNPPLLALLLICMTVSWGSAAGMQAWKRREVRFFFLMFSLAVNIGMLAFFKYESFLLSNLSAVARVFGHELNPAVRNPVLPAGISFYTFQALAYCIDVYRGRISHCRSFLDFALYISFFPQLIAGPIVRPEEFLPQCRVEPKVSGSQRAAGLALILFGLFKKIVIADSWTASFVDRVYENPGGAGMGDAWTAAVAYSIQIFADFAGYSTCAIGAALCFGFILPANFRCPYAASGFSDFWKRWHMTLSRWFRDYLYIPLGGSRRGALRNLFNLMTTMLIVGLWHGASWNFVLWGGVHGVFLGCERLLRRTGVFHGMTRKIWGQWIMVLLTFAAVTAAFVLFRSENLQQAGSMFSAMTGLSAEAGSVLTVSERGSVWILAAAVLIFHRAGRDVSLFEILRRTPWWLTGGVLGWMFFNIVLSMESHEKFIYFQF